MKWSRILQRQGFPPTTENGEDVDPFLMLSMDGADTERPPATISYSAKSNHPDYGLVGCQIHVSIHCPQDERSMNLAAEICFRKAIELFNPAAAVIGSPQLPQMPEP
jgi:hypothetical protein